jgi:hypothetical protein
MAAAAAAAAAGAITSCAAVRRLKQSAKLQGLKQPLFIEINGQRLPSPHHLYTGAASDLPRTPKREL